MLEEYFSVVIEIDEGQDYADGSTVCSKDILLKHTHSRCSFFGWRPKLIGRRKCMLSVCRELAAFYAELPSDADLGPHIQHQLFPAITTFLTSD
jgi:hypothetical protein